MICAMNVIIGSFLVWTIIGPVIGINIVLWFQGVTRGDGLGEKISMIVGSIICGPLFWAILYGTRKTQY